MPAQNFFEITNFKVGIKAGSGANAEWYGGCAADIQAEWDTPVSVLVAPGTDSGSCSGDYHLLFSDTEGTITLSQLVVSCPGAAGAAEAYTIDFSSAESIEIVATVPSDDNTTTYTYTMTFTDIAYDLGKSYALTPVGDNMYLTKLARFQIIKPNSGSYCT